MSFRAVVHRLAAGSAICVLAAGVAHAADLPSRVIAPIAPVIPVAAYSWTGFYIGGTVGGDFPKSDYTTNQVATGFDINYNTANVGLSDKRLRLGGFVGYNYEISQFVIGVEGDGAYDFGGTKTTYGLPGETYLTGGTTDSFSSRSRYDASARGRLGVVLFPSLLFYATGGVAFRDASYTASCSGGVGSFCSRAEYQSFSGTRTGYTIGGGLDGAITPNLIARIEYRYSDFGGRNLNFFGSPNGASGDFFGGRSQLTASTVTAGLAYKFNFLQAAVPVVARY